MMNDFLKRLLQAVAYWTSAMCVIHILMTTDPGYQGNWLYLFTGKIVWLIALILKIGLFTALAVGVFYLVKTAIQNQNSWQEHKAEGVINNNEEAAKRGAAHDLVIASACEFEAVAEKKRKEKELEEHRQMRHLEKFGPRSEDDALAKAMDSIKLGGFE